MKDYKWASLGCGVIARQLAQALQKEGRSLYSVANRTHEKAVAFAEEYGIRKVYDRIEDLFEDEEVDIIYISTPHNTHMDFLRKALAAGKHVLCEKSITLNTYELNEAAELARANDVILAEAMTIYHMPVYRRLKDYLDSHCLGRLQMIQMNFGSYKEYDMSNRFFNRSLAGGALLDIGVYALSFVRWFMSVMPDQISSQVRYAKTGVDEQAGILLMNSVGEMATVSLSLHAKQPKRGTIAYEKGYIEIFEYPRGEEARITITETGKTEVIREGNTDDALIYEVRDMEKTVSGESDEMYFDYTCEVMSLMTYLRETWGMVYPEEEALYGMTGEEDIPVSLPDGVPGFYYRFDTDENISDSILSMMSHHGIFPDELGKPQIIVAMEDVLDGWQVTIKYGFSLPGTFFDHGTFIIEKGKALLDEAREIASRESSSCDWDSAIADYAEKSR